MIPATGTAANIHASCIALNGKGMLILGPSGSGKSALALQLMVLGASLVADDRVDLHREGGDIITSCPPALLGMIEARGVGLLRADPVAKAVLGLVVDLGRTEAARLPPLRHIPVLGLPVPLALRAEAAHFPFALLQLLRCGRAH